MKSWARLASRFYPAAWRRRYAAEFDALLDEAGAGWMDLFDILKGTLTMHFTSWNVKAITLTFAAIGAVIAAAVAFSIPNQYSSTSVMRLTPASGDAHPVKSLLEIVQQTLSRTFLEELIAQLDLYKTQRIRMPMDDVVRNMRKDVAIRMIYSAGSSPTTAFAIQTSYSDPKLAQAVNQRLVAKFVKQNLATGRMADLEVLDSASLPQQPQYPKRAPILFAGLTSGLLIGLLVSLALGWRITIVRRSAQ